MRTMISIAFEVCLFVTFAFCFGGSAWAILDNFNDGDDEGWTVLAGNWEVESGEYVGRSTGDEQASYMGDTSWTDYTVEVKVKAMDETTHHFGVILRENGENAHYEFDIGSSPEYEGQYWFGYYDSTTWQLVQGFGWTDAEGAYEDAGEWNTLKVVAEGFTFDLYINDILVNTLEDDVGFASSGAAGVLIGRTDGHILFDDLRVEGPGIPDPALVESAGKLATLWGEMKR